MDSGRPVASNENKLPTVTEELTNLQNKLMLKKNLLADQKKFIDEWKYPSSREDLIEYAKGTVIKPVIEYSMHHFNDTSGDLFKF